MILKRLVTCCNTLSEHQGANDDQTPRWACDFTRQYCDVSETIGAGNCEGKLVCLFVCFFLSFFVCFNTANEVSDAVYLSHSVCRTFRQALVWRCLVPYYVTINFIE